MGTLFASLVVSSIGCGLFIYGKKQLRIPQLGVGLALMLYPYFISGPVLMWGIAAVLLLALHIAVRAGW